MGRSLDGFSSHSLCPPKQRLIKICITLIVIITMIYYLVKNNQIQVFRNQNNQIQVFRNQKFDQPYSCRRHFVPVKLPALTPVENQRIDECICTRAQQRAWSDRNWKRDTDQKSHTYLTPNSDVIEIGGNVGFFSKNMITMHKLNKYIVLEPMAKYHNTLKQKLSALPGNITVLNYGIGDSNRVLTIRDLGDGTSTFHKKDDARFAQKPISTVQIRDARDVLASFGIGCHELDLLTMNCEGCEMELLELFTSTTMIEYIKNIQFQPHVDLPDLVDPVRRYCTLRERLRRTHDIFYAYPFLWESWRRKNNL